MNKDILVTFSWSVQGGVEAESSGYSKAKLLRLVRSEFRAQVRKSGIFGSADKGLL